MADDLGRFGRGEAVTVRPQGWGERLAKWVRRKPTLAIACALAVISVLSIGLTIAALSDSKFVMLAVSLGMLALAVVVMVASVIWLPSLLERFRASIGQPPSKRRRWVMRGLLLVCVSLALLRVLLSDGLRGRKRPQQDPRLFSSAPREYSTGEQLLARGDLTGALPHFQEAARLETTVEDYRQTATRVERWIGLVPRLPDIAAGKAEPATPAEALEFAELCRQPFQRRYVLATLLARKAYTADPKLAADLTAAHRDTAATAAVMAAAGLDAEVSGLGAEEWGCLTDLARGWLSGDLALRAAQAKDQKTWNEVRRVLTGWKADGNLRPVRDPWWLAAMPPTDRSEWVALWAEVDRLLLTVTPSPQPTPRP